MQGSLEKEEGYGDPLYFLPRPSDQSGFFDDCGMPGAGRVRAFEWHELIALKGARSVLRGLGAQNALLLPDISFQKRRCFNETMCFGNTVLTKRENIKNITRDNHITAGFYVRDTVGIMPLQKRLV